MSDQPFMQLYVADYLADTLDLSTVEHGAYLLLLMTMWRHGAQLPNDTTKLARIARLSPAKFKPVWAEISRFFQVDGETLTNRRLAKEHQKAIKKSEVRATAGSAGGTAKALKDNNARLANASDLPCHSSEVRDQIEDDDDDAGVREVAGVMMAEVCEAAGREFGSLNGNGTRFGMSPAEVEALRRWSSDLHIPPETIMAEVRHQAGRLRDPPRSITYFTTGMQALAAQLSAPPLTPANTDGASRHDRATASDRREAAASDRLRSRLYAAARID